MASQPAPKLGVPYEHVTLVKDIPVGYEATPLSIATKRTDEGTDGGKTIVVIPGFMISTERLRFDGETIDEGLWNHPDVETVITHRFVTQRTRLDIHFMHCLLALEETRAQNISMIGVSLGTSELLQLINLAQRTRPEIARCIRSVGAILSPIQSSDLVLTQQLKLLMGRMIYTDEYVGDTSDIRAPLQRQMVRSVRAGSNKCGANMPRGSKPVFHALQHVVDVLRGARSLPRTIPDVDITSIGLNKDPLVRRANASRYAEPGRGRHYELEGDKHDASVYQNHGAFLKKTIEEALLRT